MKILIADDHATSLKLLQATLEAEGHRVLPAADGVEALAILEQEPVDAIISDILMPRMDGYRLCLEVRRSEKLSSLPFLFYTSTYTSPSDSKAALDFGADKFLKKPSPANELLQALSEAVKMPKHRVITVGAPEELGLMKEYSERLVAQLEKKNHELEAQTELLRQAHEQLRRMVEHSPAVLYTLKIQDERLVPTLLSENIQRLLGFPPAEANTYEWWLNSLHPDDRERVLAAVKAGFQAEGCSLEYRVRHRDGGYRWVQDDNRVVRDGEGASKEVVGVWTDITQRKRGEQALRESEAQYRDLFDNAHDLIQTISPDGRLLYVNRAWRETLGYADQEVANVKLHDLIPANRLSDWEDLSRDVTAGKPAKFVELEFNTKGGRRIAVEGSVTAKIVAGQAASLRCIFRDVTEKKQLEAQSFRNQRMESLGTLAGGIAHDLNNMLTPILMSLALLKDKFKDEESAALLDLLASSAHRGSEMVKQVLTFSRGFEGKRAEVRLPLVMREIQTIISQTFPKSLRVRAQYPKDLWTVRGDATQLHQVLLNLCVNARDAMPQGGTISLTAENLPLDEPFVRIHPEARAGPYVLLSVADTGTGIPADVLEKIFDPFFTTKPVGQGTGLGLSTVQGIVKGHGGFISVYTELGRGTVFKVYLPARASDPPAGQPSERAAIPLGHGELILIVDDEAAVRNIAQQTLDLYGYRALTAGDGAQAVAICAQQPGKIRLMLTDVMMPILDGHAAVRAVKKLDPQIKIIMTTGLPSEIRGTDTEHFRTNFVLQKPYTAEKLLKTIREVLDRPMHG